MIILNLIFYELLNVSNNCGNIVTFNKVIIIVIFVSRFMFLHFLQESTVFFLYKIR